MYGKTRKTDELNQLFEVQDEYKQVYDYILDKLSNNQDINISTIYSCFDIEKDSVWDKVINYQFPHDEVFEYYLNDSVTRLRISKLNNQKQVIKSRLSNVVNLDEKFALLGQMKNIDDQILKLKKEIKWYW